MRLLAKPSLTTASNFSATTTFFGVSVQVGAGKSRSVGNSNSSGAGTIASPRPTSICRGCVHCLGTPPAERALLHRLLHPKSGRRLPGIEKVEYLCNSPDVQRQDGFQRSCARHGCPRGVRGACTYDFDFPKVQALRRVHFKFASAGAILKLYTS
jgi:hypothetical protein